MLLDVFKDSEYDRDSNCRKWGLMARAPHCGHRVALITAIKNNSFLHHLTSVKIEWGYDRQPNTLKSGIDRKLYTPYAEEVLITCSWNHLLSSCSHKFKKNDIISECETHANLELMAYAPHRAPKRNASHLIKTTNLEQAVTSFKWVRWWPKVSLPESSNRWNAFHTVRTSNTHLKQ